MQFSNIWSVYTATVSASLDITQLPRSAVSSHVTSGIPSIPFADYNHSYLSLLSLHMLLQTVHHCPENFVGE